MTELAVSDGTTMGAYVARPAGKPNGAGMLVFQEAFGVNEHIRDVAQRFAALGFTALAPDLFHIRGLLVGLKGDAMMGWTPQGINLTFT